MIKSYKENHRTIGKQIGRKRKRKQSTNWSQPHSGRLGHGKNYDRQLLMDESVSMCACLLVCVCVCGIRTMDMRHNWSHADWIRNGQVFKRSIRFLPSFSLPLFLSLLASVKDKNSPVESTQTVLIMVITGRLFLLFLSLFLWWQAQAGAIEASNLSMAQVQAIQVHLVKLASFTPAIFHSNSAIDPQLRSWSLNSTGRKINQNIPSDQLLES